MMGGDFGGRRTILIGFGLAVAIIAYRAIQADAGMPSPRRFMGSVMVYGGLAVGAELAPGLAAVLAAGYTLGLLYATVASPAGKADATMGPDSDSDSKPPPRNRNKRARQKARQKREATK